MKFRYLCLLIIFIVFTSCVGQHKNSKLNGAGATFPYPLYVEMFQQYYDLTGIEIDYQASGSGAGIKQLINKQIDFAASDARLAAENFPKDTKILHIPICLGAVVLSFNLPELETIKLSAEAISKIYRQEIIRWNDPLLQQLNPDITLPDLMIIPLHRSDASGTTNIFTEFLTRTDIDWKNEIGKGMKVDWITTTTARGNQGIADKLAEQPGAIGYLEYNYAINNQLPVALIQNSSGYFAMPQSIDLYISEDNNTDMSYPLTGYSWMLVYEDLEYLKHKAKAYNLVKLLWWMTHKGQEIITETQYRQLPADQVKLTENLIKSIKFKDDNILK